MTNPRDRFRFLARQPLSQRVPVVAEAPTPKDTGGGRAVLRLYDPIDSWGGDWGVSAKEFAAVLDGLGDDVTDLELHINSPGGEVFEGIAILNVLRQHPARVTTVVDGVAASAASFVAVAGDELVMARNSELMIHDAWGLCVGNAADMRDLAADLDKMSDNLADIYAGKAGGSREEWRAAMRAETWYSAAEAVEAGLADRVAGEGADAAAKNRFDLSIFNFAGRGQAPDPYRPKAATAGGQPPPETGEESVVAFSDEQLTTLRQLSGVADDADETTILAGLQEALTEQADPPAPAAQPTVPDGMTLVEADVLAQLRADAAAGAQARAQQLREDRDRVLDSAVADGRITPARRDHWRQAWDADPDGTRQLLATLPAGLVPLAEVGFGNTPDATADDALYAELYPTVKGS